MPPLQRNWVDRVVGFFDPEAEARRVRARSMMAYFSNDGGYVGADRTRSATRAFNPANTSADRATLGSIGRLRALSRDMVRNNPLAGGAVNTVTTSVVGTGLTVKPMPRWRLLGITEQQARAWSDTARELFELWAMNPAWCDVSRRLNFYQLQELCFRSALESGDGIGLLTESGPADAIVRTQVQLIEADRVSNPSHSADTLTLAGGIRSGANGALLSAFIADRHPGDYSGTPATWTEVSFLGAFGRRNLVQVIDMTRPGQRRGVPYLSPVIEPLKQLGTYTDAEVTAAVVSAMFTAFIKTESGGTGYTPAAAPGPNGGAAPPLASNELALGPGAIVGLASNEDVVFANPGRPNARFDPFVQAVLQQIGVRLELPLEVLVKHFTSSYSAARAALLEAWRFFRKRRTVLSWQFCQPVYEAVIMQMVLSGRLSAPGMFTDPVVRAAWLSATWIGDAAGAIDPEKEVNAAQKRVDLGISTLDAESIAFDGVSWEDKHPQRVREHQARAEAGLDVAAGQPGAAAAQSANDAEDAAESDQPGEADDSNDSAPEDSADDTTEDATEDPAGAHARRTR